MLLFGYLADRYGRRLLFTLYSLLTAASLYPLAFHWQALLPHPVLFWGAFLGLGLGSGCTAGFGALLAELFPTDIRNFAMGTTYNTARGIQFFAPFVVRPFVGALRPGGRPERAAGARAGDRRRGCGRCPETRSRDLAEVGQENGRQPATRAQRSAAQGWRPRPAPVRCLASHAQSASARLSTARRDVAARAARPSRALAGWMPISDTWQPSSADRKPARTDGGSVWVEALMPSASRQSTQATVPGGWSRWAASISMTRSGRKRRSGTGEVLGSGARRR